MFIVRKKEEVLRFGLFLLLVGLMAFYVASTLPAWWATGSAKVQQEQEPVTGPIIAGPQATDLLDAAESHTDGSDFFAATRMERERTRAALRETLKEVMDNPNVSEEARQRAGEQYLALGQMIALEQQAEMIVRSRGFSDVLVSIGEKTVQVVIRAASPSEQQYLQVQDAVAGVTGMSPSAIRVRAIE